MINIPIFGLSKPKEPKSNAFNIDTITKSLNLDNKFSTIIKITASISGAFVNSFNSLDKQFSTISVTLNIRIDYLDCNNELYFNKFTLYELNNICTGSYVCDNSNVISLDIIDIDILNIYENKINLYIVYFCSLEI